MASISRNLLIKASPSKVFEAITTEKGISGWWTKSCSTSNQVGGEVEFRFKKGDVTARMTVQAFDPAKKVHWLCVSSQNIPEWQNTSISFELSPAGKDETEVHFRHGEWKNETEWYEHFSDGWDYFLRSLKSFVETGSGTPDGT